MAVTDHQIRRQALAPPVAAGADAAQAATEPRFPYHYWLPQVEALRRQYQSAEPFPHIVLENFLEPRLARQMLAEFPPLSTEWIHWVHVNQRKYGTTDRNSLPPTIGSVIDEFNSPPFMGFLSRITGINDLLSDATLEGGGLHQSGPGGFLNVHADFTVHPHRPKWRRRINLLLYLNPDWRPSYGGELELWDRTMRHCVRKVAPTFNRCLIFNTDHDSFHGHPDPMTLPEGVTRKSLALYYFTEEADARVRSTEYRARPGDGLKRVSIYLDKIVLRSYDHVKRKLHLSDRFASRLLRRLSRSA
jgi:hypothetical protein